MNNKFTGTVKNKFTGTVTIDVNQFVELNKRAEEREVLLEEVDNLRYEVKSLRAILLQRLFNKYNMKYNTRVQQTAIYEDGTPKYTFGYTNEDVTLLKSVGFTMDDLIKYINDQWDSKEAEMLGDSDGEDEEE